MIRRYAVVGSSGSGKSTLAHRIAVAINAPVIQLDAVFHQPGWTELPDEQFRNRVGELVAGEQWVVDGNYAMVRDIVWEAADVIVWVDVPRWLALVRVTRRTVVRGITRRQLWNGNHEDWRNIFELDPTANMILWTWTTHEDRRHRYEVLQALGEGPRWIRLCSAREVDEFATAIELA